MKAVLMTKKLSGAVVLLSIVVLLTNGCVYDLLNASIKLDGMECKTPAGEWDRNQKDVECVSFDVVEKCKGKTFRVAIDGEIAPSRSQSAMGGTKSCGGRRKE